MKILDMEAVLDKKTWDTIAQHSDIEKSILIGILEYGISIIGKTESFERDLIVYSSIQLKGLQNLNKNLQLCAPTSSISLTTNELLKVIKNRALKGRLRTLKKVRDSILRSTKVTYYPPYRIIQDRIVITETTITIYVKCNMPQKINRLVCDYSQQMVIGILET